MLPAWTLPLAAASAGTIAWRLAMLAPLTGSPDAWQRAEAQRMVAEKWAALQEAQLVAAGLAWQAAVAPWSLWAAAGGSPRRALDRASADLARPFLRRASANARRLQARAATPAFVAPWTAWWSGGDAARIAATSGRRTGTRRRPRA